jgi:hypothetical protein
MRRSVLAVLVSLVALAFPVAAQADAPQRTTIEISTPYAVDPVTSQVCGFTVAGESTFTATVTSFFDESDKLAKEIAHIHISGLLVKVATGETLFTHARYTLVFDVAAGTTSASGLRFSAQRASEPPSLQVVGHRVAGEGGVLDPDHQTPRFIAPIIQAVCAAFST